MKVHQTKLFAVVRLLSAFGILLAIYLLWEQLFQPPFQPCNINDTVNCNAIISGSVSKTLGIPTPVIGLLGYIGIFIASTLKRARIILGLSTFGLAFCLWIAYRELFELRVICPVCIGCQLIMISEFILSIILVSKKK